MKILIISKQEIKKLISLFELITAVRLAYISYERDKKIKPQRSVAQVNDNSIVVNMPGTLPNYPIFTVKVNIKNSSNLSIGLPFLMGSILLFDNKTGQLLSLMDSGLI